jgi:hypothetical protein
LEQIKFAVVERNGNISIIPAANPRKGVHDAAIAASPTTNS